MAFPSNPASLCTIQAGGSQQLDVEMLEKLCGLLDQSHVPWKELAEKLGMLTLAHLYQESPSPCQNLLENYQVSKRVLFRNAVSGSGWPL